MPSYFSYQQILLAVFAYETVLVSLTKTLFMLCTPLNSSDFLFLHSSTNVFCVVLHSYTYVGMKKMAHHDAFRLFKELSTIKLSSSPTNDPCSQHTSGTTYLENIMKMELLDMLIYIFHLIGDIFTMMIYTMRKRCSPSISTYIYVCINCRLMGRLPGLVAYTNLRWGSKPLHSPTIPWGFLLHS